MKPILYTVAALCVLVYSTKVYRPSHVPWQYGVRAPSLAVPIPVFWGTASFESSMRSDAIGTNGFDHGLFQLYCVFDAYRMQRWGWFDPLNPMDSARIARKIYADNGRAFHSTLYRVTAYRWGINGARRHGADLWYYNHVMKEAKYFEGGKR